MIKYEEMHSVLNEECGVFGIYNVANASEIVYYGLHALQHRGQEGCGIVLRNVCLMDLSISMHFIFIVLANVFIIFTGGKSGQIILSFMQSVALM